MIHPRCCSQSCSFLDHLCQKEVIRTGLVDAAQLSWVLNKTTVHHCGICGLRLLDPMLCVSLFAFCFGVLSFVWLSAKVLYI